MKKGNNQAFKYIETEILSVEDMPNYQEMQEIEKKLAAHQWDLETFEKQLDNLDI